MSSQIEGTQASLEGVLEFEANLTPKEDVNEIKEVINYIRALNYGMGRLNELLMSLMLIREIHKILLEGTRGAKKNPGEFRELQNYSVSSVYAVKLIDLLFEISVISTEDAVEKLKVSTVMANELV